MDLDALRAAQGLKPLPNTTPAPQAKPVIVKEDATFGNEELIRGIPAVGRVSGTIKGTRPGDTVARLEQANRDLHQALMRRARTNLKGNP